MKILCVCGTGQGSSLILRISIEEILKEQGLRADVEHTDPSCAAGDRCDFIVTSKEIAESINNPRAKKVIITNYFNKTILKVEIAEILEALSKK